MTLIASARQQWLANPRRDLLAGTVVALALIPEAIAFSIIAGVDPAVGLYASVVIAITIAFVGPLPPEYLEDDALRAFIRDTNRGRTAWFLDDFDALKARLN